jgi:hypothetical protein
MLTATGSQLILDVLAQFQLQDRVFTAYDITQAVRAKTSERIDHPDVQSLVHDQWTNGDFDDHYERDDMVQLDVSGKPFAIVYYPDIKESSDHPKALSQPMPANPQIQPQPAPHIHPLSPAAKAAGSPASVSIPASTTPAKRLGGATKQTDGSYACELTAEGRINIPKALVDKVNKDNGTVDVTINGSLEIITPNADGRIRLSLLNKGFKVGDGAYVELTANNASISVGGMS